MGARANGPGMEAWLCHAPAGLCSHQAGLFTSQPPLPHL